MNVTCPKCTNEFRVRGIAQAIKEQSLWLSLKYKGDLLAASTISGLIDNFEKVMRFSAEDLGVKATTYIRSIINKPHDLKIEFIVICDVPEFAKKVVEAMDAWKEEVLAEQPSIIEEATDA